MNLKKDNFYSNDYGETWNKTCIPQPLLYSSNCSMNDFLNKIETSANKAISKVVQKVQGAVERNEDLIEDSARYMTTEEYQNVVKANP